MLRNDVAYKEQIHLGRFLERRRNKRAGDWEAGRFIAGLADFSLTHYSGGCVADIFGARRNSLQLGSRGMPCQYGCHPRTISSEFRSLRLSIFFVVVERHR